MESRRLPRAVCTLYGSYGIVGLLIVFGLAYHLTLLRRGLPRFRLAAHVCAPPPMAQPRACGSRHVLIPFARVFPAFRPKADRVALPREQTEVR